MNASATLGAAVMHGAIIGMYILIGAGMIASAIKGRK